jgi:AcrR family transcriptional regulator
MAAIRNDNVKEKILDAASSLLTEDNLNQASLQQISDKAEISKGTLYYYYKTKEDLLFDLADRYFTRQYEELYAWCTDKTKDTSFPRLFKYVLERDVHDPAIRFHLLYSAASGNDALRAKLIERYRLFEKAIAELTAQRVPQMSADYLAWLSLLISDGIIVQCELHNDDFDPDRFIKETEKLLKSGISFRQPDGCD